MNASHDFLDLLISHKIIAITTTTIITPTHTPALNISPIAWHPLVAEVINNNKAKNKVLLRFMLRCFNFYVLFYLWIYLQNFVLPHQVNVWKNIAFCFNDLRQMGIKFLYRL